MRFYLFYLYKWRYIKILWSFRYKEKSIRKKENHKGSKNLFLGEQFLSNSNPFILHHYKLGKK